MTTDSKPTRAERLEAALPQSERCTPDSVFKPLDEEFRFTVDAAASKWNAKTQRFFDRERDAMTCDWTDERVWCNPPHVAFDLPRWILKAKASNAACVVMLLPAKPESAWWQDYVEPDRVSGAAEVRFLRGRLRFSKVNSKEKDNPSMWGFAVVIWRRQNA